MKSWTPDDPGECDTDGLSQLSRHLGDAIDIATGALKALTSISSTAHSYTWEGASADQIKARIEHLIADLKRLITSYDTAKRAVDRYVNRILDLQTCIQRTNNSYNAAFEDLQDAITKRDLWNVENYQAPMPGLSNPYQKQVDQYQAEVGVSAAKGFQYVDDRTGYDTEVKNALNDAHDQGLHNRSNWSKIWGSTTKKIGAIREIPGDVWGAAGDSVADIQQYLRDQADLIDKGIKLSAVIVGGGPLIPALELNDPASALTQQLLREARDTALRKMGVTTSWHDIPGILNIGPNIEGYPIPKVIDIETNAGPVHISTNAAAKHLMQDADNLVKNGAPASAIDDYVNAQLAELIQAIRNATKNGIPYTPDGDWVIQDGWELAFGKPDSAEHYPSVTHAISINNKRH